MKVLWLCNIMLPVIAGYFHLETSNKEGWLSGLAAEVLRRKRENGIELAIAFPAPSELLKNKEHGVLSARISYQEEVFDVYGFAEDITRPDSYDAGLEERCAHIIADYKPEVVHCFGTEYPHTLAMCRVFPQKDRILVGIQGLCSVYANAYFANLPEQVVHSVTLRDWLKQDSILQQYRKFVKRGKMEMEALQLTGNVTGRTAWDEYYTKQWNPDVRYHFMNETLRPQFYEGSWEEEKCIPHTIFLSQGDYPIKGLHYMLLALPRIRECYPDVHVYVAGNSIVKYTTLKDKLKISAYGRYLRKIMIKEKLEKHVTFLGKLNAEEMKQQYLACHLFVCCSSIENSPNSLGEAMLLGVPCVSADVGGVPDIFTGSRDGILYGGYKNKKNAYDNMRNLICGEETTLEENVKSLENAVFEMWSDKKQMLTYCENARKHAKMNHNKEENYRRMTEIYAEIINGST